MEADESLDTLHRLRAASNLAVNCRLRNVLRKKERQEAHRDKGRRFVSYCSLADA